MIFYKVWWKMDLQYYYSSDFAVFEELFLKIEHQKRRYQKKETLSTNGDLMEEMFYILNGTMAFSFLHESGHVKASCFYGKGYLAPLYYPGDLEVFRSVTITAVSELDVLVFDRKKFKKYLNNNLELNEAMYKGYIELVGMLIQDNANQLFCNGMEKICNFFYIYLENIKSDENIINLSQAEIMEFVGLNSTNVSKYLKVLRDEGIIKTERNKIIVLNIEKLKKYTLFEK